MYPRTKRGLPDVPRQRHDTARDQATICSALSRHENRFASLQPGCLDAPPAKNAVRLFSAAREGYTAQVNAASTVAVVAIPKDPRSTLALSFHHQNREGPSFALIRPFLTADRGRFVASLHHRVSSFLESFFFWTKPVSARIFGPQRGKVWRRYRRILAVNQGLYNGFPWPGGLHLNLRWRRRNAPFALPRFLLPVRV